MNSNREPIAEDGAESWSADSIASHVLRAWDEPKICHGFLGRIGGVSRGPFATLNMSRQVGDERLAVDENRARLRSLLPPGAVLALMKQMHGNRVCTIGLESKGAKIEADGLVTASGGIVVGALSADCVPILMMDAESGVVGALHSGWRGALADIAGNGVRAMLALGAITGEIRVALGPSIGPCCFEVDQSLADRFRDEIDGAARHVRSGKPGKAYIDLRGVIGGQLVRTGVDRDRILSVGPCTRCASDQYFSRRAAIARGKLNGGPANTTGLQLSFIGLAE